MAQMTEVASTTTNSAQSGKDRVADDKPRHPYDYYYRPGMELRPLPTRAKPSPAWLPVRKFLAADLVDHEITLIAQETPAARLLADHLWQGDEQMDGVVAMFRRVGAARGRQMLDQALDHGIETVDDPPAELVALFEQLDNPPPWHDPETWERGRIVWRSASIAGKIGMFLIDAAYTMMGEDVAAATGSTGWFAQNTLLRTRDSAAWFASVNLPGAMERFAEPFKDTVRLRLMHSQVRAGMLQSWSDDTFAHRANPISNSAMAGGLGAFGLSPLIIDRHLGRKISEDELNDVTKFFAYTLYIFGVTDELLAKNVRDAMANTEYVASLGGPGMTEWTPQLTEALHKTLADLPALQLGRHAGKLVEEAIVPLLWGYFNYLVGEDMVRVIFDNRAGRKYSTTELKILTMVTKNAISIPPRISSILDQLPGAAARKKRAAVGGDAMLTGMLKLVEMAVSRADANGPEIVARRASFAGHDSTPSGDFAKIS